MVTDTAFEELLHTVLSTIN